MVIMNLTLIFAEVHEFDIKEKYGITQSGIESAINLSKNIFTEEPNDTVILFFDEGVHIIDHNGSAISLDSINPGSTGELIFYGAGMDKTTLVFANMEETSLEAKNVSRITFKDMHFTRSVPVATQGSLKIAHEVFNWLVLDIPKGFPTTLDILNNNSHHHHGRYLRRYKNTEFPELLDHETVEWSHTSYYDVGQWKIKVKGDLVLENWTTGDLVGVKSDCCGKHGGIVYNFTESENIVFENIKWTRQSKGVFRNGTKKVRLSNCKVEREPRTEGGNWCLSSSSDGPVFGHPDDLSVQDVIIDNFYSDAIGGDSLQFYNVLSNVTISNSFIKDSFGSGILLYNSPDDQVIMVNNTLIRSDIKKVNPPN